MSSSLAPVALVEFPPIDARLAPPETRYEVWDGKLVYVTPADNPHGRLQVQLSSLLNASRVPAFEVVSEVLLRVTKKDDFAPDVSVVRVPPSATSPHEAPQLAFEIINTGSLGRTSEKAEKLVARGVRRVFAIHLRKKRVYEWSKRKSGWKVLDSTALIVDRTLIVPLPVSTLFLDAEGDNFVAQALLAKGNPVLEQVRAESDAEGRAKGMGEAVIAVLAARGLAPTRDERARVLSERAPEVVLRWIGRAATCASVAELFAPDAGEHRL